MPSVTFHTVLRRAVSVAVPSHVVAALGATDVYVTIGEHSYPGRVSRRRGEFRLPIASGHRAAAGIEAGDEIYVTLAL